MIENRHRKYLGLKEIDPGWTRVEVRGEVLYHNGIFVLKEIQNDRDGYFECDLKEPLPEKLNKTATYKFKTRTVYFSYCSTHVKIGNIRTQRAFVEDTIQDLDEWLDEWISDTRDEDLEELREFCEGSRLHQKYKEGDFFAFKLSRRQWGFGRILYDIGKRRKAPEFIAGKNYGLTNLLGHALIVQVYHYISSGPDVEIDLLKSCPMLPSVPIFDNRFLYGDYKIIGNAPLEESEIIPWESYGRSLNQAESFWYLQYGLVYKEKKHPPLWVKKTFRNEYIGFSLNVNQRLIRSCIDAGSNMPYWSQDVYYVKEDLRNPLNAKARKRIFKHFGVKA